MLGERVGGWAAKRRQRACATLGLPLVASLVAAIVGELGLFEFADLLAALPLLILAGNAAGAGWAVLAYYLVARGVLALLVRADPERGLTFALFALIVWVAAGKHVDASWRAVWSR